MFPISKSADTAAKWTAIAIGFSVPISVALDNALMLLVPVLWLMSGHFREKYAIIRNSKTALAALALIGLLAVGMLYGNASFRDALNTFGKYIDLLFVPVFITLFRDQKARNHALSAFVFSMLLTLILSYLLKFGIVRQNSILRGVADNPYVFKLHITQNFFMSYAALILATWAFNEKDPKTRILSGILAIFASFDVLFMVQGRIGYVVLALLLPYLFIRKFGAKGVVIGMLAVILLGAAAYLGSKEFHQRIDIAVSEFSRWHPGQASQQSSSIGDRMEYYTNTLKIIREHPFFGVGTGGFDKAYASRVANTSMLATHNPHNEYLLIASQLGLPGLMLLLSLFYIQWREAGTLPVREQYLAHGLVLAMMSGCLFNSFLLDHAEGLFFAFMTGVLFSGKEQA